MNKLLVIAFGGNALLRGDQAGTIHEQEKNIYDTCNKVVNLIKKGYDVVIGHGNGPQVGTVLMQHEAGMRLYGLPKQPIDFCVAETQGSIGYMIEQQLQNVLSEHGIEKNIVTLVTQVLVDKNDEAFKNPTKPVGPFYSKEESDKLNKDNGWIFKEDPRDRGWRRVVPSPKPSDIPSWHAVEKLARDGNIVITVGGGGIPAYIESDGKFSGIDAVIDKDLASSLLASKIKADEFIILTDVPNVCINFNTPEEKKLKEIKLSEAKKYLEEGHFAEGSMAPKIKACIQFVENSKNKAEITDASQIGKNEKGTIIF